MFKEKINTISLKVFKTLPLKITQKSSLSSYVFLLEYENQKKYILKIINSKFNNPLKKGRE